MSDEFKFTWERMNLCFPEWKRDMTEVKFNNYFPKSPDFSGEQVSFAYKKEYGVQMFLNQTIPVWIKETSKEECVMIERMYLDLSYKLYNETVMELDGSFKIIEGWRQFIAKHDGNKWIGNLSDHLDFKNEGKLITLGDYYKFYINSDYKNNSPTDILHKIQKLPADSLNEKWKKYAELTENISKGINKDNSNEITGSSLAECISNADEIYKFASELKELKF